MYSVHIIIQPIQICKKEMKTMKDRLDCPVCLERFRVPRTLAACGHTYCDACLNTMLKASVKSQQEHQHGYEKAMIIVSKKHLSFTSQRSYQSNWTKYTFLFHKTYLNACKRALLGFSVNIFARLTSTCALLFSSERSRKQKSA